MDKVSLLGIEAVFGFRNEPIEQPAVPIDASVIISGSPWQKTDVLYADESNEFQVGIWESSEGAWHVLAEEDEYIRVLQGRVRVTDIHGGEKLFDPNDSFFLPRNFKGTWENIGEVRKIFVSLRRKK